MGWVSEWVSEWVSGWARGLTSPSTNYISFRRRVLVNHLRWYWRPNKNNQATEHKNNLIIAQPKRVLILTAQHIHQKKPRQETGQTEPGLVAFLSTSDQETERVYSYNPGARTGLWGGKVYFMGQPHTIAWCTNAYRGASDIWMP